MAAEPDNRVSDRPIGSWRSGLIRNALFNSGSYLVAVVVSVAVTPILVGLLGFDGYGAFVLITGLIGYYTLLDFGLSQGVTRYVAEFKAKDELAQAVGPILIAVAFNFVVGFLASLPVFVFAPTVVGWIHCPTPMVADATAAVRIGAFGFIGSMISGTFASTLVGLERYDLTAKIESASIILQNTSIVVALYYGGGLVAAVGLAVAVTACSLVVYAYLCVRFIPAMRHRPHFEWATLVSLSSYSFYLFAAKISNVISVHGVRFFIAWQFGPAAVTLFSVPMKLLGAFGGLLSTASSVLFPYASRLGVSSVDRLERVLLESTRAFALVSIFGYVLIAGCAFPLLALWMGRSFANEAWILLAILAVAQMVASQSTVPNQIVSGMGESKLLGLFGLTALICFAVFLPSFAVLWGLTGVAVGMLASSLLSVSVVFGKALPALEIAVGPFLRATYKRYILVLVIALVLTVPSGMAARDLSMLVSILFPLLILAIGYQMWRTDPDLRSYVHRFVPGAQ